MIRVITKRDIELLFEFYKKINLFNEEYVRQIYDNLGDSLIMFASIDADNITTLLSVSIINHNYHMEKILYLKKDESLIRSLISFALSELRLDERGLKVIYDNFPYSPLMHEILLEQGFKWNNLNMQFKANDEKMELIDSRLALNDKKEDVILYIYKRLIEDIKSNDLYLGVNSLIPDINSIRLENTSIAVMRGNEGNVVGTVRFGKVSDSILLDSLYADNEDIYCSLINLVKNLTSRNIEVSISPSRIKLTNLLASLGFEIIQADYFMKLN